MNQTITATDLLTTIYAHPGPYTTVYLATRPLLHDSDADADRRWGDLRRDLERQGAPQSALDAITARLALPAPEDTAATVVIAAADGVTVVDHALEPPAHDYAVVDTLPYAAPLLEWHQRRIPHLVVTLDGTGADIALFGHQHWQELDTVEGRDGALADAIARRAGSIDAELIVLAGELPHANPMADRLRHRVPAACRIVTEPLDLGSDELADATVRHVSDTAARTTVHYLRERRYLATHNAAVDGTERTVRALANRSANLILIHDDPADQRRCWIGSQAHHLSLEPTTGHDRQARLVDAVIRSAVLQDIPVHIIPSTGPTGPEDDTAALTRDFESPVELG